MPPSSVKPELVRQSLLEWISSGRLRPGERLPSEQALARQFSVSVETLRRGMAQLAEDGVIIKRPRVGNFVLKPETMPTQALQVVAAFPSYQFNPAKQMAGTPLILEGIEEELDRRTYTLSTLSYEESRFEEQVTRVLLERGVAGLALKAHWQVPTDQVRSLQEADIEVVLISDHPHLIELGLPSFHMQSAAVLSQILRGLLDRGHRDIVIVYYSHPPYQWHRDSIIRRFINDLGTDNPDRCCLRLENAAGIVAYKQLDNLLDRDSLPSVVVVPDECVASAVFRRCYQRGIRIPEDLSLAACHDSLPDVHPVPLTAPDTARWFHHQGKMAGAHLRQRLEGQTPPAVNVEIIGELRWKASVAPGPHAGPPRTRRGHARRRSHQLESGAVSG